MTSETVEIDKVAYTDALPTFQARPADFERELRALLKGDILRHALASIEEQALLKEKAMVQLDATAPNIGVLLAREQANITTLRNVIDHLIDMSAEKDPTDEPQPQETGHE